MWREKPTDLVTPECASIVASAAVDALGGVTGYWTLDGGMRWSAQGVSAAAWNAVMNDARVLALLEEIRLEAFKAGWESSGQGYNAEVPDEGIPWEHMAGREAYENWLEQRS